MSQRRINSVLVCITFIHFFADISSFTELENTTFTWTKLFHLKLKWTLSVIEIQSFLITTAFTEDCADILNKLLIPGYFVVYFFARIPYIC